MQFSNDILPIALNSFSFVKYHYENGLILYQEEEEPVPPEKLVHDHAKIICPCYWKYIDSSLFNDLVEFIKKTDHMKIQTSVYYQTVEHDNKFIPILYLITTHKNIPLINILKYMEPLDNLQYLVDHFNCEEIKYISFAHWHDIVELPRFVDFVTQHFDIVRYYNQYTCEINIVLSNQCFINNVKLLLNSSALNENTYLKFYRKYITQCNVYADGDVDAGLKMLYRWIGKHNYLNLYFITYDVFGKTFPNILRYNANISLEPFHSIENQNFMRKVGRDFYFDICINNPTYIPIFLNYFYPLTPQQFEICKERKLYALMKFCPTYMASTEMKTLFRNHYGLTQRMYDSFEFLIENKDIDDIIDNYMHCKFLIKQKELCATRECFIDKDPIEDGEYYIMCPNGHVTRYLQMDKCGMCRQKMINELCINQENKKKRKRE